MCLCFFLGYMFFEVRNYIYIIVFRYSIIFSVNLDYILRYKIKFSIYYYGYKYRVNWRENKSKFFNYYYYRLRRKKREIFSVKLFF